MVLAFTAMAAYRDSFEYGNASTDDMNAVFSTVYGTDLTWFFDEWVYGQGYPEYNIFWESVPAGNDYETTICIHQIQTNAPPVFHMPVEIRFYTTGIDTLVRIPITTAPQQYVITLADSVTSIDFDPDQWLLMHSQIFVGIDELNGGVLVNDISMVSNPARHPKITLIINHRSDVEIQVYDINGRLVKQIDAGNRRPGLHQVDIGQMNAGVYFCRMETEQAEVVKKLVVVN